MIMQPKRDRKQPDRKFIKSAFGIANTKAYLKENTYLPLLQSSLLLCLPSSNSFQEVINLEENFHERGGFLKKRGGRRPFL